MRCEHSLQLVEEKHGSQKARFKCVKCNTPFAFYGNYSLQQTEDYVNKYYQEIISVDGDQPMERSVKGVGTSKASNAELGKQ